MRRVRSIRWLGESVALKGSEVAFPQLAKREDADRRLKGCADVSRIFAARSRLESIGSESRDCVKLTPCRCVGSSSSSARLRAQSCHSGTASVASSWARNRDTTRLAASVCSFASTRGRVGLFEEAVKTEGGVKLPTTVNEIRNFARPTLRTGLRTKYPENGLKRSRRCPRLPDSSWERRRRTP